jgi:hypothetical protein
MKIQKSKTILLSLVLTTFIGATNIAHAQSFGDVFSGFKNKVTEAASAAAEAAAKAGKATTTKIKTASVSEDKVVTNSLLEISGQASADTKWVMIIVKKGSYEDKIAYAAPGGKYQMRVALQDDAGVYDVELYNNVNENRNTDYYQFKKFKVENTDSRDMSFLLPTDRAQSDDPKIVSLVKEVTKDAQSDEEAFVAIYKYVAATVRYDNASLKDGSYANKMYDAVSVIETPIAVCMGYANLLAAMSRAYGIRTKVIYGTAVMSYGPAGHAWNEVLINDEWRMADATWDEGRKNMTYLFMDPAEFGKRHTEGKVMSY